MSIKRSGNIFPEELKLFENCVEPGNLKKEGQLQCPALCDICQVI